MSARRDTWTYRAHKFVRRHRVGVGAAAVIVVLLAASTVTTWLQSARIARERDKAEQVSGFLVDLFSAPNPYAGVGREVTARVLLDSGAARVARDLATHPEVRAQLMATMGQAYYGLGLYENALRQLEPALAIRRQRMARSTLSYCARPISWRWRSSMAAAPPRPSRSTARYFRRAARVHGVA